MGGGERDVSDRDGAWALLGIDPAEATTPTTLIFRSESGRTEVSTGPRGVQIHVLRGQDTLTTRDANRLTEALTRLDGAS